MRQGDLLLIDEISLAEDAVLERLNSVLEPERTLFLAEKGGAQVRNSNFGRVLIYQCADGRDQSGRAVSRAGHDESWRRFRQEGAVACSSQPLHRGVGACAHE